MTERASTFRPDVQGLSAVAVAVSSFSSFWRDRLSQLGKARPSAAFALGAACMPASAAADVRSALERAQ